MKNKKLITLLVLVLLFRTGSAQDKSNTMPATVYFMRSTGMTGTGPFNCFIDDSLACHLHNNCYSIHMVNTGVHKFQVRAGGKQPKKRIRTLDLSIEAGQTYYISLDVTNQMYTASLYLMEVTVNTAKKMLPTLKEDKNCN